MPSQLQNRRIADWLRRLFGAGTDGQVATLSGGVGTWADPSGGGTEASEFGATLIDDEDAAEARATLGLGTAAVASTGDFEAAGVLATHAAGRSHGISVYGATLVDDADASSARTTLGLGSAATTSSGAYESAGTVASHSAMVSGVHGISAYGATLVDDADATAARATLGLGDAATTSVHRGTALVDFGAFPGGSDAAVAVTGQTAIQSGSVVNAWIRPADTDDHLADEHWVESIAVFAGGITAGVGFRIYARNTSEITEPNPAAVPSRGPVGSSRPTPGGGAGTRLYGLWSVQWQWSE